MPRYIRVGGRSEQDSRINVFAVVEAKGRAHTRAGDINCSWKLSLDIIGSWPVAVGPSSAGESILLVKIERAPENERRHGAIIMSNELKVYTAEHLGGERERGRERIETSNLRKNKIARGERISVVAENARSKIDIELHKLDPAALPAASSEEAGKHSYR